MTDFHISDGFPLLQKSLLMPLQHKCTIGRPVMAEFTVSLHLFTVIVVYFLKKISIKTWVGLTFYLFVLKRVEETFMFSLGMHYIGIRCLKNSFSTWQISRFLPIFPSIIRGWATARVILTLSLPEAQPNVKTAIKII